MRSRYLEKYGSRAFKSAQIPIELYQAQRVDYITRTLRRLVTQSDWNDRSVSKEERQRRWQSLLVFFNVQVGFSFATGGQPKKDLSDDKYDLGRNGAFEGVKLLILVLIKPTDLNSKSQDKDPTTLL